MSRPDPWRRPGSTARDNNGGTNGGGILPPAGKPVWYRRRGVLVGAVVVVILAVTVISDLPQHTSIASQVSDETTVINEINADDLRHMQQKGDDFLLIDVREREEQAKGTIPGAVHLPRGILEVNIDQITTDKDRKLVLYCGGGSRSALAAVNLKKMGFKNVISLAGGYRGWHDTETR